MSGERIEVQIETITGEERETVGRQQLSQRVKEPMASHRGLDIGEYLKQLPTFDSHPVVNKLRNDN